MHIVVYNNTDQKNHIQIGLLFNAEKTKTNLILEQGSQVLITKIIDGNEILNYLQPITYPELNVMPQLTVEKSIDEMVAHTRYLADVFGTKAQQKIIEHLIKRVYAHR